VTDPNHHPFQSALDKAMATGDYLVQARVVATQGSTYRKSGARMLFTAQGQQLGLVSGGCLESSLAQVARQVMATGRSIIKFYDFRAQGDQELDDVAWSLGGGCNGAVKVMVERLGPDNQYVPLKSYLDALRGTEDVWLFSDQQGVEHQLLPKNHEWIEPQALAQEKVIEIESQRGTGFVEKMSPAPGLLIFGAGADAPPLVQLASRLGYRVWVLDCRDQLIQRMQFNTGIQPEFCQPENLNDWLQSKWVQAAMIMSHSIDLDQRVLAQSEIQQLPYLGLLGPADRKANIIKKLHLDLPNLHGPAGLDLGGEGPDAIALSVMAEIQQTLQGYQGGSLNSKTIGIHDRGK